MWIQVEEVAIDGDLRFSKLARRLGLSYGDAFHAFAKVTRLLWKSGGAALDPEDVEAAAGIDDFAATLVAVGLAEALAEGLLVWGHERAKKYARTCDKQSDRATKGWQPGGKRRRKAAAREPQNSPDATEQRESCGRDDTAVDGNPESMPRDCHGSAAAIPRESLGIGDVVVDTNPESMPRDSHGIAAAMPRESRGIRDVADVTKEMPRQSHGNARGNADQKKLPTTVGSLSGSGLRDSAPSSEPDSETENSASPRARARSQGDGAQMPLLGDAGPAQPVASAGRSATREVTDHWHARYQERTGDPPTWKRERHFPNLARLLDQHHHDAAMFIARIDVLFDAPPRFLAGSVPDFDTFLQHFDKLAAPARASPKPVAGSGGKVWTPDELAARAREVMDAERRAGLR